MNILVVVAHPDDEILGMGGTLIKHRNAGDKIFIHILTDGHSARLKKAKAKFLNDHSVKRRIKSAKLLASKLNAAKILVDGFYDQMLDTYPLLKIVKSIESFAKNIEPDVVYTHFSGDVNKDHKVTLEAVLTAFRPINEKVPSKILCTEIPASTEWGNCVFHPNYFVDISDVLNEKLELLSFYDYELKKSPHPRSNEKIKNLAYFRGSSVFVNAAEAFYLVREIWK